MNWAFKSNFDAKKRNLLIRSQTFTSIRKYFDEIGFTEVQTPVLQKCPTIDAHIHGFETSLHGIDLGHQETLYLQTSPEFDMKKLLAAGMERIYQICPVFRNSEGSKRHSSEFTMLEWYRVDADYTDIMNDCRELVRFIAKQINIPKIQDCDLFTEWQKLSVRGAFLQYAHIDLDLYLDDKKTFAKAIAEQGIRVSDSDEWDDLFFRVMAEKIEPFLGFDAPCFLYDYPVSMASLSRKKPQDPRYAERFELYICGVELANAFSELTDADEQRKRYETEMNIKEKLYGIRYPLDEEFIDALRYGLPQSAGIAMGLDRLIMLFTGAQDIENVQWVPSPKARPLGK